MSLYFFVYIPTKMRFFYMHYCSYSSYSALFFFLAISLIVGTSSSSSLTVGYYQETCPSAEVIVRRTVEEAIARDPGLGAGLIRLHFHDCFVRGCDASVLLDSTPGKPSEKDFSVNDPHIQGGLRGFEVIDKAKSRIEAQCPSTVSCADIVAFAARDSAHTLGHIHYTVPAGRHDGRISNMAEAAQNLPSPFFNVTELRENFARKGLSLGDMVTLSGAHSIGISRCGAFAPRLYSNKLTNKQDPSLDPALAVKLRKLCPQNSLNNRSVPLDFTTPNLLDNVYYRNLLRRKGVLISDQVLVSDQSTVGFVKAYAKYTTKWARKYAKAVVKMGYIGVISGDEGEIRRNCRVVNH